MGNREEGGSERERERERARERERERDSQKGRMTGRNLYREDLVSVYMSTCRCGMDLRLSRLPSHS